jgi:hypothetical protein
VQAATGSVVLRAGMHRIRLSTDTAKSGPSESGLGLEWQGPGILLSDVPDSALFRAAQR